MKIVHVVEATFAGVGRHVLDLVGGQLALGHEVDVVHSPRRMSSDFASERSRLDAVGWYELPVGRGLGLGDWAVVRRLRRLVGDLRPAIIHGHSTKGGLLARLADPGPDCRVIYTPNAIYTMNPGLGALAGSVVGAGERLLAKRTTATIAVSPEERAHLLSLGFDPGKVEVVPNGIGPVDVADGAEVRQHLGLPLDEPVIGFVGRLDDQKAPLDLVEVLAAIDRLDEAPRSHLLVIGDGPLRPALEARVAGFDHPDRIHLVGTQPGTWAMAAMDALLLPSRYEGLPYVLIEAATLGVPIVTTETANASLLFTGPAAADGVVCATGDIGAMARACVGLLTTDRRRPAHLGAGAPAGSGSADRGRLRSATHGEGLAGSRPSQLDARSPFTIEDMVASVDRIYRSGHAD